MRDSVEHSLIAFARRRSVKRTLLLLATTALTSPLLVVVAQAQNLPTGGSVAAGNVAIAQPSANQLNITQSSQSAVVNWQSFSVGQGSAVNIAQPNSSAALLNRVTGNTPSTISGSITANGQVYLVNPNGIAITQSGTVNTGGFVASTLGISDADFMAGKRTFTGNGASAAVSNAGSINVGRGGYAALIGGTVSNSGSINVPLGKAGLGSGEQATLDFSGDGFLQVAVPTSAGGSGALIRNSGSITADGGSVTISAATAREAARNAVNISGFVQARSIDGHTGAIVIGGGAGGKVKISGRLDASSPHGTGGRINVTGNNIKLREATVDASGKTGGGSIAIDGGIRGSGPLQRAETTSIDSNTVIRADAVTSGNGGNVVVWSDQLTTFAGTISAQGGALGGDGGFVETSGKERLSVRDTAFVNTLAPMGATGNWLLDPRNITVATGGAATLPEGSFGSGNNASDITIAPTTINAAASNVTLQANNDITINNNIGMTNSVMLTLNAGRSILVNANVVSKGGFTATINDAGAASANRSAGKAAFTMAAGTSISTVPTTAVAAGAISITTGTLAADSTGATSLAANVGDITLAALNSSGFAGATTSAGGNVTVTNSQGNILSAASGTVTITANGATPSGGSNVAGGAGGTIQLTATNGAIGSSVTSLGAISATGGAGRATNANGGNGGAVTLTAGTSIWDSAITTTGGLKAGTGTNGTTGAIQNLATNGSITMTTDSLSAGALTFTANAGSGVVTIQSLTPSTTMGINNSGSALNLTAANLALITAKTLNFGSAAMTGQITLGAATLPGSIGNVVVTTASPDLVADGAIKVTGNITGATGNLALNATASDIYLLGGTISVGTFSANAATYITSAGGTYSNTSGTAAFSAGTAAGIGDPNYGNLSFLGTVAAGTLTLNAQGIVYSGFTINANNLLVQGGGTFNLFTASTLDQTTSTNTIGTIASNVTGTLNVSNNASLAIGSVGGINGVTAGTFRVTFAGTRTLTQTQAINANTMVLRTTNVVSTYSLTNANNQIGTFAASVGANGTLRLSGTNGLTIGGALTDDNGNALATGITAGTLTLSNTGPVAQNGRVSATNLELLGTGGNYILNNPSNVIGTLSANTGSINVARTSAAALTVGTAGGTSGITTTGAVTLAGNSTAVGGITVNGAINSGGDVRLLSAGGIAVNANITATGGKGIRLLPDTAASGSVSQAVTFGGGAKATTSGAGATSIYFNTTSYTSPSQNYATNVNGTLIPYMYVATLANLQAMQTNLTGNYALNKDIDASSSAAMNGGAGFAPVGNGSGAFGGRFDGLSHVISGLTINRPGENFVGLFGNASNATISNVGLAGGSITGGVAVGSLVGSQFGGSVSNSYSSATVTGNSSVGGLVGFADGTIRTSYATGNVSGSDSVGGIAGYLSGTITQSYATGAVTGTSKVGGLVGELEPGLGALSSSYWDTQTSGRANAFGSGSTSGATGLTTAQFTSASNFAGWTFGTTAGGPGWVIVDANSTLNNAGGAAGATRPMLLSEASTNGTITNAHQLQLMALNLGGTYTLGGAIDMAETARASGVWLNAGFVPVGYAATNGTGTVPTSGTFAVTSANPFTGAFDGKGFTISNLFINRPTTDYVGLFGYAYNPAGNQIIKNVNLVGGSITGRDHVGSILGGNRGYLDDGSTVATIYLNDTTSAASSSSATVTGRDFVGGLYGSVESSWSYFNTGAGTVSGRDYTGGVVGWINSSSGFNTDMRSSATVNGRNNVGGVGGYFAAGLSGINYATGNVTATGDNVGGFAGYFYGTLSGNSTYASGAVSGVNNVGGLAGFNAGQITQAFATGAVSGNTNVGGLVGNNDGTANSGFIDLSFATGIVRGTTNVGGLVGLNTNVIGALNNTGGAYATGAVYGTTNVGGLVGSNTGNSTTSYGRIASSYSIGYVSGTTNVGGLVGNSTVSGTNGFIKSSYFNTDASGQSNALGTGTTGTGGIATSSMPKTTAQMQSMVLGAAGYNWSTSAWGIGTGANISFAYFKWLYASAPQVVTGTAYGDRGTTPLVGTAAGLSVSGLSGAAANVAASAVGSTGANGYYYFLLPASTLTGGSPKQVLAYTAGASGGATLQQNASASISGLSIYGTYLKEQGAATTLSTLSTALSAAAASNTAAQTRLASLANLEIDPTANFVIDQAVNTNTLVLSGTGTWTQSAAVTANNLLLLGTGGNYTLTNAGNSIGTLAANTGAISLTDTGSLTVGSVAGTTGVTSTGAVTLVSSGGNVSIASSAKVTAGSNANVVLSAAGNFINNRGSDAIGVSGTGRWLVYSNAPGTDTFGPNAAAYLDSGQTAVWNATLATRAPGTVPAGNRYIFAYQPTLTFASTNAVKTYGEDATATVSSSFAVTGLQSGVTGAFAGDTASAIYSGAPVFTSTGSAASAAVGSGSYTITGSNGSLASLSGYTLAVTGGTLTVNPATLTVTAANQNKTYGETANLGTTGFTTAGLVTANGDSVTGVTLASLGATGSAGVNGGAPYSLEASAATGSGLSNYTVSYVSGGLTVNPAALTITATNQSKTYGDTANLGATGFTTAGLVTANGDTVTGVTLASLGAAGSAGVNGGTSYSLDASAATGSGLPNYTVSYVSGGLTVNPAALTITAANQNKTYGDVKNLGTTGFTTAGLVTANGDDVTGVTLTSSGAAGSAGVNGGVPYSIDASAAIGSGLSNYTIAYVSGGLTVNPAALTITANNAGKTYGQSLTLAGTAFGTSGLQNGESVGSVTLASAGAAGTADVAGSPYAITASGATGGSFNSANYKIGYVNGALSVAPASITVTADSQTRGAGTPNAPLTYQLSGNLYNGDSLTGALATSATTASSAGSYSITQGSLAASANYNLTYQGALLTVTPTTSQSGNGPTPSNPTPPGSFVRDSFYPVILPDNARPVFGAATFSTSEGTGVLYADPRFDKVFVCFTSAPGTAQSCYAAGAIKG